MINVNEKMAALGTQRSVIRELFEFGKKELPKSARKMYLISRLEIQAYRPRHRLKSMP